MPLLTVLMMLPRFCSIIGRMNRRVTFSAPKIFTPNDFCQSASVVSSVVVRPLGGKSSRWRKAALLISTSTVPKRSIVFAKTSSIAASFVTSMSAVKTFAPFAVNAGSSGSVPSHDRSVDTTFAPAFKKPMVYARPIPRAPPVITTTRPLSPADVFGVCTTWDLVSEAPHPRGGEDDLIVGLARRRQRTRATRPATA